MKLTDQMSAAVEGIWAELYLIEYTKVFGIGIAKAKSTEVTRLFAS